MKIQEEIDLYKYNTMRLHSVADVMYMPQSHDELTELIRDWNKSALIEKDVIHSII